MDKKAIILLSGGIDSTTTLVIAISQGYIPYCLSFDYNQRHRDELKAAQKIADKYQVIQHRIVKFALFGGSALNDNLLDVPKHQSVDELETGIPITYVPARNTIFLSFALSWAETLNCHDIFIGVNALDYSGYPDCRPEYIEQYSAMANLATKQNLSIPLTIHTPLINLKKSEIIQKGLDLNVDYSMTLSCYDPIDSIACGQCDSCLLRRKGFEELGREDVIIYKVYDR